jgi:hypothetical protein
MLVVLDEFPYLVDSAPALPSIVQKWLDHTAPSTKVKLVLSGSHISAMRQLEGADQPLYGRRTRRFVIAPFGVREVGLFVPGYSPQDRLLAYGTLGGLPGHLALLDPKRDFASNAAALLLDPPGRLVDEAQHVLDAFLTDAIVHYSIIEAIATGDQTQIDLVALDGDGALLVGECKWGEVTTQDVTALERRAGLLASELGSIRRTHVAVFSGRGAFDEGVVAAREAGRMLCFTGAELVGSDGR